MVAAMEAAEVDREIIGYRMKLSALSIRFHSGERSGITAEAQAHADGLMLLLDVAPVEKRGKIDRLIDRYETLRIHSSN